MKQLFAVCLLSLFAGCQEETIRAQRVTNPPDIAVRTVAVMVPRTEATWFFKLSGPAAAVATEEPNFQHLIETVKFAPGDPPLTWTTPSCWTVGPPHRERFATLKTESGIDCTITHLGPEAKDVLPNVIRWRRQIGLPPMTEAELPKLTKSMKVGASDATWVDLVNPGPEAVPLRKSEAIVAEPKSASTSTKKTLGFQTPSGWEQQPASGFRAATFRAGSGESVADVSVTPLDGLAGGLAANVNRWRGELKLPNADEKAIRESAKELVIDGQPAMYFDLLGPDGAKRERTLAVIAERGARTWFIKMRGPAEAVARQQAAFEAFALSMKFPTGPKHD